MTLALSPIPTTQTNPVTDACNEILTLIAAKGHNYSTVPLATSYEDGEWAIYVDVAITDFIRFDIRTQHPCLLNALKNAIRQLKRELS